MPEKTNIAIAENSDVSAGYVGRFDPVVHPESGKFKNVLFAETGNRFYVERLWEEVYQN